LPNRQGKVRADPGGFAERQCQRLHKSLLQHGGRSENRFAADGNDIYLYSIIACRLRSAR
jgi:hypothetical protein